MTISFACDQCGKKYATPSEFAGRSLRCKRCAAVLTIPAGPEASAPARPPTPPPARPAPGSSPSAPPRARPRPAPPAPAPPPDDDDGTPYGLAEPAPIELGVEDVVDDAPPAGGVRRTWGRAPSGPTAAGASMPARPGAPFPISGSSSSSRGSGGGDGPSRKAVGVGLGGIVAVALFVARIAARTGLRSMGRDAAPDRPPPLAPASGPRVPGLPDPGGAGGARSLVDARRGFRTRLMRRERADVAVPEPPPGVFDLVEYPAPAGTLAAYLTPDPGDGARHPAILWITGGDCNTIGDVWSPSPPNNDQSARAFREAGVAMMFPSLRGGNRNPGVKEGFLGEVDDVLAAADFLASKPWVDPARLYLGGHSSGGTLAMLAAASTDRFRAVFSFGPIDAITNYPADLTPFPLDDRIEVALRSPIAWLGAIRCPTYVIEGTGGNIDALRQMARINRNPLLHFFPVRGADHFDVLGPATARIAPKVAAADGPPANALLVARDFAGIP